MALATTGITTYLVGSTLGTTSRSVSTLCTHSAINKWSQKKPVELSSAAPNRSGTWYKGDDGCCGFKESSILFSDVSALITAYNNGTTYQYQPPTGYKRLADFGGYEHSAQSPIWAGSCEGQIYTSVTSEQSFQYTLDTNTVSGSLTLADFAPDGVTPLTSYYFGVIIKVGNYTYYKTMSQTVGDTQQLSVGLGGSDVSTLGTHSIYPAFFISSATALTTNYKLGFVAVPTPKSGTMQTTFTVKGNALEGSIGWLYAWYSQAAKLTIGGTLSYKKSYEGNNVTITYGYLLNGTNTTFTSQSVTLSHTGTNGTENYTMDIEYTRNAATQSGMIYWIRATLGTYTVETQCDDSGGMDETI